jgi:hypothetical protein
MNLFDNPDVLPGIALHQPYAGLVRLGIKDIETRMHQCHYRGRVVICATRVFSPNLEAEHRAKLVPSRVSSMDFTVAMSWLGCVMAIAELVDCRLLAKSDEPRSCFWSDDDAGKRYAWILKDIQRTATRPIRCMQGWFPVPCGLVKV